MKINIALVGNPNSGKTTMYNNLTGSSQYVGNWPGVTVEKKEGKLKGNKDVTIVDLPGIYSLSPYTLEEVVSRNYLIDEKPDVILNIVDSTNIERNLYLTSQIMEMGIPVVIALNMTDVVRKNGDNIDVEKLSRKLGCEIIETAAIRGEGCVEAANKAVLLVEQNRKMTPKHTFSNEVEQALLSIRDLVIKNIGQKDFRWYEIKLFERDEKVIEKLNLSVDIVDSIEESISKIEEKLDDDSESIITSERYRFISEVVNECVKRKNKSKTTPSDKIDRVITNRFLALPIFAFVMFIVYYVSVSTVGSMMTDWVNDILFGEVVPPAIQRFLINIGSSEWLNSLILDGIVAGVGAVLGFLPQMLVLFLFLALLEDCGYMSRIAFIMDRVFCKFGLSGKSFIPMLIGTGCGVPGIMASRTIENERDRKITIMTTTFIPCSAKLPIVALIAGALFPKSTWVAPSAYFIGIAAIIISGVMLKKTKGLSGEPAPFVMELPPYHMPSPKGVLIHMWDRGKSFVQKAGTIIFVMSVVIWFLSTFNFSLEMVDTRDSILAVLGSVLAPVFAPLGWGNWEAAVATITGLVAKENVVGTFGILFGFAEVAEDGAEVWPIMQQSFTALSAYSFLIFNLLCAPCFAAIGAIKREMGSAKWTWIAIGYQTGFAYVISLIVYQIGMLVTGGGFRFGTAAAFILLGLIFYMVFRPVIQGDVKQIKNSKRAVRA